jgi:hypothetical protein
MSRRIKGFARTILRKDLVKVLKYLDFLEFQDKHLVFVPDEKSLEALSAAQSETAFVQDEAYADEAGTYGLIMNVIRRATPAQRIKIRRQLATAIAILMEGWMVTLISEDLMQGYPVSFFAEDFGSLIEKYRAKYRNDAAEIDEERTRKAYERAKKAFNRATKALRRAIKRR